MIDKKELENSVRCAVKLAENKPTQTYWDMIVRDVLKDTLEFLTQETEHETVRSLPADM